MLTGRSVILAIIAVAVLSLVVALWDLVQPPDRGGLGIDSYGTRPTGYRAIFDILAELGAEVDRAVVPPIASLPRTGTVVLWGPDTALVSSEPTYLNRIGEWIRHGGRVVVAPAPAKNEIQQERHGVRLGGSPIKVTTAVEQLGLPPVGTRTISLARGRDPLEAEDSGSGTARDTESADDLDLVERIRASMPGAHEPTRRVDVTLAGDFAPLGGEIRELELPEHLQTLNIGPTEPSGRITVASGEDSAEVIAARYALGEGEIIVVSDPKMFENRLIAQADNAVLAVRLLGPAEGMVLWDEFYHGLTIRGKPLYLLTHGPYLVFALLLLAATLAWVWRGAMFLGPPLAPVETARRSLGEYIEAMARFLHRGPESNRFVLAEMRSGVLWSIRHKLGLPPGEEKPQELAAAIARHDPTAARRLLDAVAAVDLTLSQPARIPDRQFLAALKGLDDCL